MGKKAKDHLNELLELMKERPELPVLPMCSSEIVGDECGWYGGEWDFAQVTKFVRGDERIYFYDEKDMEECLLDFYGWDYEKWSEEKALEAYKTLNWTECIAVYIIEP